jgi:hypothetical protein
LPRLSPEARGAALRHAKSLTPPAPPQDLSPAARDLWNAIVKGKPSDWWMGEGALRLLRRYVRLALLAEEMHDRLDELGIDHPDAGNLTKCILSISSTLGLLATKLRLSVQTGIERHSAHRFEPGLAPKPWEDDWRAAFTGRKQQ